MGRKSNEQKRYEAMSAPQQTVYQLEKMNKNLKQINRMIVNNGHTLMYALQLQCEITLANHNITNKNSVVHENYSKSLQQKLDHLKAL